MSAILLRKKKFFRPPSQFEKMCIKVFVNCFVASSVFSIVLSFISLNSSIAPQETQIKPFRIDKYQSLLIDTIIYSAIGISIVYQSHFECKYKLVNYRSIQVFTHSLFQCIGCLLPYIIFNSDLLGTTILAFLLQILISYIYSFYLIKE